jgi:hypothetical protein
MLPKKNFDTSETPLENSFFVKWFLKENYIYRESNKTLEGLDVFMKGIELQMSNRFIPIALQFM